MRFLSLPLVALAVGVCLASDPPAEFAPNQTAAKPAPFDVKMVDQGKWDPRLKGILAPDGFKTEVVADESVITNPVGMTFAPDGTLYVLEWKPDPGREWYPLEETFRYRDGTTRRVTTMKKFVTDPVKVLRYNTAKGIYDKSDVIFTDELPSSILWHDGWLYTTGRGTVRRHRQSKAGGPWDIREIIAQGFCGFHHHQVSGLTIGPDGWLYLTSGDDDNFVEGSDGSRATVMRTGGVFRCKPDGSQMEVFSLGYRNPYRDVVFDQNANIFHSDNDQEDGSKFQGCRIVHVAEGADFGWRLFPGAKCCRTDFVRGAVAGELPGKVPPMIKTGRGSPAGVLLYQDTQLPKQYQHLMYYPDVYRKLIRAYTVAPQGSTFAITHEFEFMKSDDPLFRPCQMLTGPDGAIYVCDWRTDSGGAGKLWGDGAHGRIYRMTWVGTKADPKIDARPMNSWAKAGGPQASLDTLAKSLKSADFTVRDLAQKELVRRAASDAEKVRGVFATVFKSADVPLPQRLWAAGALAQLWNQDVRKQFLTVLNDEPEPDIRRVVAELLGRNAAKSDFAVNEALAKRLEDDAAAVRRAAALALGRLGANGAADAVIHAWKADDGQDAYLTDAYIRAFERIGTRAMNALLAVATSGKPADTEMVVKAFAAMRTREAADALPELLGNVHLKAEQRAGLIRSYTNYIFETPVSLEPLAEFLAKRPKEPAAVLIAGLDVMAEANSLGGGKPAAFVVGLLAAPDEGVRMAALAAVEKNRLASAAGALKAMFVDGQKSLGERTAILKAMRAIPNADFAAAVRAVLESKTEPATVKAEALRTLAAFDPPAARKLAEVLLENPDPTLIAEAIATLGSSKAGAKLIGEKYLAKKLPRDLFPRVSESLRKFPDDPVIAKLNADVMKGGLLLSASPAEIEKLRKLVQAKGDAKRGKLLYLNTGLVACASCHRLEGVGGAVGPDLSRMWETQSLEKLIEGIVEPSKEIKEGFQTYQAVTLDGQSFSGLKVAESPTEVTIRESTGRDIRLKRDDLDVLKPSKLSLMPDNVVSQLSFDQFIDLLAFLKSRTEQESLRGLVLEYSVLAGVPADLKAGHEAEKNPDPTAKGWQPKAVDPNALLNVKGFVPSGATGVYALAYVFSPKKQTAQARLLGDDPIRVWANGKLAFERPVAKLQRFEDAETFAVELNEGWNPLLVKVVTTGRTHNLGLQLSGSELRTATKPEVK